MLSIASLLVPALAALASAIPPQAPNSTIFSTLIPDQENPASNSPWKSVLSFNQTRLRTFIASEMPFVGTLCKHQGYCILTTDELLNVQYPGRYSTDQFRISALGRGVDGGWSGKGGVAATTGTVRTRLIAGQCGYYTFFPIYKEICGFWSAGGGEDCELGLQFLPTGHVDGRVVFVRTECDTNVPLLKAEQDPVFSEGQPLGGPSVRDMLGTWMGVECWAEWDFLLDTFGLRGKNWSKRHMGTDQHGQVDGSVIRRSMEKCAGLTGWRFIYNKEANEWSAFGNLVVGQRRCIPVSLEFAGGIVGKHSSSCYLDG